MRYCHDDSAGASGQNVDIIGTVLLIINFHLVGSRRGEEMTITGAMMMDYFPMQNVENIRFRMSSAVVSPVRLSRLRRVV